MLVNTEELCFFFFFWKSSTDQEDDQCIKNAVDRTGYDQNVVSVGAVALGVGMPVVIDWSTLKDGR